MAAGLTTLAWCGWRLRMPETWRPLRVEGGARTGGMMIGDATEAILRVDWASVTGPRARRLWSRRGRAASATEPAVPSGFTDCRLVRPAKGRQAVWTGYAEHVGLLLELVYNRQASAERMAEIEGVVLPSLAAQTPAANHGTPWAIFGARFLAPPGFDLLGHSLHLGEISLRFARGKDRLSVGQVYPAELALSRRPLGFWLRAWPWERRTARRFRSRGEDHAWRAAEGAAEPAGLIRRGRKSIRWPLGFLAARKTLSAAVVDSRRGRIFRAEMECPREPDEAVLREAIANMDAETAEES